MTHSLRTKSAINRFQYSIENPFPIAKTADVFRAILLLLTPLLFTACAGIDPKTYHPPKRKSSLVLSDELRWKAMARIGLFGYTYALPQGTYPAILEDRNGLYYKSPTDDYLDGNMSSQQRGGIYIPNDGSLARVYIWPTLGFNPALGAVATAILYQDAGGGRVPLPSVYLPNDWKTKVRIVSQ